MRLPTRIQEAMQMQVEAERKKRAAILESEGASKFQNLLLCISMVKVKSKVQVFDYPAECQL